MYSRRPTSQVSPEDRKMLIDVSAWEVQCLYAYCTFGAPRFCQTSALARLVQQYYSYKETTCVFSILIGQTSVAEWLIVASITTRTQIKNDPLI